MAPGHERKGDARKKGEHGGARKDDPVIVANSHIDKSWQKHGSAYHRQEDAVDEKYGSCVEQCEAAALVDASRRNAKASGHVRQKY